MQAEQETVTIPGKSYAWVKCNRGFHGFFVTEYSFPWSNFIDVLDAEPTVNPKPFKIPSIDSFVVVL